MSRFKQMDPELKTKWLKALRGGGYRQGVGALRRRSEDDGKLNYCCLGVLATVAGEPWYDEYCDGSSYGIPIANDYVMATLLPNKVLDKVGMTKTAQRRLASMNDGDDDYKKHSFRQIADWIEENL